jgi:hypothetical protein
LLAFLLMFSAVIASEAKQSRAPATPLDCFVSLAMTAANERQVIIPQDIREKAGLLPHTEAARQLAPLNDQGPSLQILHIGGAAPAKLRTILRQPVRPAA